MSASSSRDQFHLGFLAAVEDPERGYVGGLLVTNRNGRPLEFQCTAPVKPNRTQEILYGPTLMPYVLGELIGRTLLDKIGVKPHLLLTESDELLELRQHVTMPVASLSSADTAAVSKPALTLGRQRLVFHEAHGGDSETVAKSAALIPAQADLLEPFERVREALQETIRPGAVR